MSNPIIVRVFVRVKLDSVSAFLEYGRVSTNACFLFSHLNSDGVHYAPKFELNIFSIWLVLFFLPKYVLSPLHSCLASVSSSLFCSHSDFSQNQMWLELKKSDQLENFNVSLWLKDTVPYNLRSLQWLPSTSVDLSHASLKSYTPGNWVSRNLFPCFLHFPGFPTCSLFISSPFHFFQVIFIELVLIWRQWDIVVNMSMWTRVWRTSWISGHPQVPYLPQRSQSKMSYAPS